MSTRPELVHATVECKFCGHLYIEPCDSAAKAKGCGNKRAKKEGEAK